MGQNVLKNTRSKRGSKDRTKEKLENRVNRKSRLDFPNKGLIANSALGTGKWFCPAGKAEWAFLGMDLKPTWL